MTKKLFIITGDPSADVHAAKLCLRLKERVQDIDRAAVGGVNLSNT